MKIGLVIEHFDPERGGAEHWTFQHAANLVRYGHEVHVVASSFGSAAQQHPFTCHAFGFHRSRLARAEAAEQVLRKLSLDLVHDIGLGWFCDVFQSEDGSRIAQWEAMLQTLPRSARSFKRQLIRFLPRYNEFRELMKHQYGDPDRIVIAVARMCAEHYQRYHDISDNRLRVIYHGTDTQRFSPSHRAQYREVTRSLLGVEDHEVVFLFVGHDFVRKGLRTAIRAVSALRRRGHPVRLLVVGRSVQRRVRHEFRRNRLVIHCGRVANVVPYYSAADAFVLPTFYDPCSLSVGEAAASNLPVITTTSNGASELLQEGVHGYVLPDAADDVALAMKLEELMCPALREKMGAAARSLALDYPLDRNCHEIMNVYEEAVQEARQATISIASATKPRIADVTRPLVTRRAA